MFILFLNGRLLPLWKAYCFSLLLVSLVWLSAATPVACFIESRPEPIIASSVFNPLPTGHRPPPQQCRPQPCPRTASPNHHLSPPNPPSSDTNLLHSKKLMSPPDKIQEGKAANKTPCTEPPPRPAPPHQRSVGSESGRPSISTGPSLLGLA